MASLTTDEKSRIEQQIDAEIPLADKAAKINQGWDTAFKISIFIMGIMIVIVSALAASNILQTHLSLSTESNDLKSWSIRLIRRGGIIPAPNSIKPRQNFLPFGICNKRGF